MGRELRRVPLGFDWPIGKAWWGFVMDSVPCQTCGGSGNASQEVTNGFKLHDGTWHTYKSNYCPTCEGEGTVTPKVNIPEGPGYQLWETVSEGSPVSPTFATPEELANWLAQNDTSITKGVDYDGWLRFINGPGWAPSMMFIPKKGIISGVEGMAESK